MKTLIMKFGDNGFYNAYSCDVDDGLTITEALEYGLNKLIEYFDDHFYISLRGLTDKGLALDGTYPDDFEPPLDWLRRVLTIARFA